MKFFIQYLNCDSSATLTTPCGDRAVIILDGRLPLSNMISIANKSNGTNRPTYPFFEIRKGNFLKSHVIYSNIVSKNINPQMEQ